MVKRKHVDVDVGFKIPRLEDEDTRLEFPTSDETLEPQEFIQPLSFQENYTFVQPNNQVVEVREFAQPNNQVVEVKQSMVETLRDDDSEMLESFSRLLQMNDLRQALKQVIPSISEENIKAFESKDSSSLEKVMPIIVCTAILKSKDENNSVTLLNSMVTSIIELLKDFLDPKLHAELEKCWSQIERMIRLDTGYGQKYFLKVKSMSEEEILSIISNMSPSMDFSKVVISLLPICLKIITSVLKENKDD